MAKLRPSRLSPTGLQDADAPPRVAGRGWLPAVAFLVGGLLVLAWFDGGEEPLHPIAENVVLPEQSE
jgi:hypothetical protein